MLEAAMKEMDMNKIKQELLKDDCDVIDFKFNVPQASHMGGAWERAIRSVRAVLNSILQDHGTLDDELLRTFFAEAESVVNSQPLSYSSMTSTNLVEPLTANHLLTMKAKVLLPLPGTFVKSDLYAKQRWRRVQFLAQQFWHRWRREVLTALQQRHKWQRPARSLQVDDIVVMSDDELPRGRWPLARVVQTYVSADGLVRKVRVRTVQGEYDRPVQRLILMMEGFPDGEPSEC